jgi:hypothetical protein
MTLRTLFDQLSTFVENHPDHEALDAVVVVRIQTNGEDEDLHVGELREITIDAGCTDTFALVLDADQTSEQPFSETTSTDE